MNKYYSKKLSQINSDVNTKEVTNEQLVRIINSIKDILHRLSKNKIGIEIVDDIILDYENIFDELIGAGNEISRMSDFYYSHSIPIDNESEVYVKTFDVIEKLNIIKRKAEYVINSPYIWEHNQAIYDFISFVIGNMNEYISILNDNITTYNHMKKRFSED